MTDPYFNNVVLLLHCDGSDGSTTFTDSSISAKTVTANGNAQVDTAQSKWGGASALFDGTDDYLTAPDSNDWDFGTGDFTLEAWVRFTSHSSVVTLLGNYLNSTTGWTFQRRSDTNTFAFGNGDSLLVQSSFTPTDGVWYHMAVCRSGTSLRTFIDGAQIGSTVTNSTDITGSTTSLYIGVLNFSGTIQDFNGHLDDIRITKGVARYTSNFTAPSSEFPNNPGIDLTGIQSEEAFGTAAITRTGPFYITSAGGIASSEAFGTATVTRRVIVAVSGAGNIASSEAFGTPVVQPSIQEFISDTVSCSYAVSAVRPVRDEWVDMVAIGFAQAAGEDVEFATELTTTVSPSSTYMSYILRSGTKWFGRSGSTLYVSDDFITWSNFAIGSLVSGYDFTNTSLKYANGRWFMSVYNGSVYKIVTTTNFSSFTELTFPGSASDNYLLAAAYGGGTWLLHKGSGPGESRFFTSTDLSSWTEGGIDYNTSASPGQFAVSADGVSYVDGAWWLVGYPYGGALKLFASSATPLGTFSSSGVVMTGVYGQFFDAGDTYVFGGNKAFVYRSGAWEETPPAGLTSAFIVGAIEGAAVASDGDATQYRLFDVASWSWLPVATLISGYTGDQWWNSIAAGGSELMLEYYDDVAASPEIGIVRLFSFGVRSAEVSPLMMIPSTLTQNLALSDRVGFYAEWLMQDTVNLTLTPAVAARFPFTLLDSLNVIPSASGALSFDLSTGDALALSDVMRAALALTLQDSMLVSYALAASLRLRLALADTTTLSDTLAPTTTLQITLQDNADLGDSMVGTLNLYLTLRDGAVLEVLAEQDDASYLCLALNLALGGATTYEAYNFPYMAHFRGRTLLGNDQGLYEVAGSDDAGTPFHATFATGLMDFGDARAKRLQALYVGHDSAGETFIGTLSGNDRTARWYRLSPTDGDFQTERASTALGVAARYWAIEVDSVDSFEIDSIELRPVVTARKVRG